MLLVLEQTILRQEAPSSYPQCVGYLELWAAWTQGIAPAHRRLTALAMSTGESSTTKQLILYVNIPNNAGILVDIFPDCILVSDVLKKVLLRLNHSLPGYGFYCPSRINKRRASFLLLSKTLHHSRVKNGV